MAFNTSWSSPSISCSGNQLGVCGIFVHVVEIKPKQPCRQDIIRVDFRSIITPFDRQDDDTSCPHSLHALVIAISVPWLRYFHTQVEGSQFRMRVYMRHLSPSHNQVPFPLSLPMILPLALHTYQGFPVDSSTLFYQTATSSLRFGSLSSYLSHHPSNPLV